jgi:AcrR family transcriptional regulator
VAFSTNTKFPGIVCLVRNADRRAQSIDALLRATLDSLAEVGYARFRVADVAPRCGLSQGLLFRYFPTKQDLMRACLERAMADHLAHFSEVFSELEIDQVSRRVLLTKLWEVLTHPDFLWTYEFYAASYYDEELAGRLRPFFEANSANIEELVKDFIPERLVPAASLVETVDLAIWSMQGLALNGMARGGLERQEQLISYLLRISDGVFGPEVPVEDVATLVAGQ